MEKRIDRPDGKVPLEAWGSVGGLVGFASGLPVFFGLKILLDGAPWLDTADATMGALLIAAGIGLGVGLVVGMVGGGLHRLWNDLARRASAPAERQTGDA